MPRSALDRSDKRQAVLQAASEVFLAHGFSATTTDMVQRHAGVSKATLYGLFPGKQALFAEVIQVNCAAMEQALRQLPNTGDDLAAGLAGFGRAYLRFLLSPQGLALLRVVVADAPRFPQLARDFFLAGPSAVKAMLAPEIARAAAAGQLDLGRLGAEAAAELLLDMVRGQAQMEALTHPQSMASAARIEAWVSRAVATFMAAFGSSP